MENKFELGEVVVFKSQPKLKMVVTVISKKGKWIQTAWYDNDLHEFQQAEFAVYCLCHLEPRSSEKTKCSEKEFEQFKWQAINARATLYPGKSLEEVIAILDSLKDKFMIE